MYPKYHSLLQNQQDNKCINQLHFLCMWIRPVQSPGSSNVPRLSPVGSLGMRLLQTVGMSPDSPQVESLGTRLLQTVGMPPGSPQLSKGRTCKQGSSYAPGLHSLLLCMATWNFSVWQDFLQLHCLLNRILTQRKYKKWLFRMSRRWMLFRTGRQFILSRAV